LVCGDTERIGPRSVDIVQAHERRPFVRQRDRDCGAGAAGAEEHQPASLQCDTALAQRLDAAQSIEHFGFPAVAVAGERVHGTDKLPLRTDRRSELGRAQLVRNREDEAVQIAQAHDPIEARIEVSGQHVQRHEHGLHAAAAERRREHFGRSHLHDRIADDAEEARSAGNVVDFVGRGSGWHD
jgi:hypothetical protein